MLKLSFILLFSVLAVTDVVFAIRSASKGSRGRVLAVCALFAGWVTLTYMASVLVDSYLAMSVFSSLYFVGTNLTVATLLLYIWMFVNNTNTLRLPKYFYPLYLWCAIDSAIMLINPFKEIALSYTPSVDYLAYWQYAEMPLHEIHVVFNYIMVGVSFMLVFIAMLRVSKIYRSKYLTMVVSMLAAVIVNSLFVFVPLMGVDFSILLYTVLAALFYLNDFRYSDKNLAHQAQQLILNEMDHPVVFFDDLGKFVICNDAADFLVPETLRVHSYTIEDFLKDNSFDARLAHSLDITYFHVSPDNETTYRCDFHPLFDERLKLIGRLFVLTNNSLDVDSLTGFNTKHQMELVYKDENVPVVYPTTVILCDINKLGIINHEYGHIVGDQAIEILSKAMRKVCPPDTYFVRYDEANLIAICPNVEILEAREIIAAIHLEVDRLNNLPCVVSIQSSFSTVPSDEREILAAVTSSSRTLTSRKMLDASSAHASLLASLAQVQTESDYDTEAHVQRTRSMGDLLGFRLGLSDSELSDLSLICLLHDIGKVGIPLEILNKPGKLTEEEWAVMQDHVWKGYRICQASQELQKIADPILHHHESWNGKGYPDGLKGEAIPLLSRIIAVVDTFDAMTHDRPYSRGITTEAAIAELKRCAGTQFDPSIVAEFVKLIEEMYDVESKPANETADAVRMEGAQRPAGTVSDDDSSLKSTKSSVNPIAYTRYTLRNDGHIFSIDEAFTKMTGYTEADVAELQLTQEDLIFPEDRAEYFAYVAEHINSSEGVYVEHRIKRKGGSSIDVFCYGKRYFDSAAKEMRDEVVFIDAKKTQVLKNFLRSNLRKARHNIVRMETLIKADPLTGVLTRTAFKSDVDLRLLKGGRKVLFLMLDIDNFKDINDSYGHSFGDDVLISVATELSDIVGKNGMIARMGGDEFAAAIHLPLDTAAEECLGIANYIFEELTKHISAKYKDKTCTLSFGASCSSATDDNFQTLYESADSALYEAKNSGRNKLVCNI